MRILIAEDDYASRLLLASILKNQGHDVVECADGLEAYEMPFSMILPFRWPSWIG